jgi:hypothetical protein
MPDGSKKRKKSKTLMELVKCGTEYFNYSNKAEVKMYSIDKLMCLKSKNYSL